jgi:hypothetical protein
MQPYEHEIFFPESEGGFTGQTLNNSMQHGNWATNGSQSHHSHDLADVVREQDDLGRGRHPGGVQDHRLSSDELLNDPSVSRLGRPTTMSSNFYGDGRVGRANWHMPHPETPHGVNAEAVYNWDKGGYDFKYTSDGVRLAPTHNYVPEGAPVHVPGRAPQLSLEH